MFRYPTVGYEAWIIRSATEIEPLDFKGLQRGRDFINAELMLV